MARCLHCGKRGIFLRLDSNGNCTNCAENLRRKLESEEYQRRVKESMEEKLALIHEKQHRAEEEARIEEARIEAEKLSELRKPYTPSEYRNDSCCVYTYREVGIYVPDDMMEAAAAVPPRSRLSFKPEPSNEYDRFALAVYHDTTKIGYMYKGSLRTMVKDFSKNSGREVLAFSRFWEKEPIMDLFFYRSVRSLIMSMQKHPGFRSFTLVSNKGEEMQENLSYCDNGETVEIDYDCEKYRYLALAGGVEIGYFSASATKYFNEHSDVIARISSVYENDNGKYCAIIAVAPKSPTEESET